MAARTLDLTQPFFHNGGFNPDLPLPTVEITRHLVTDGFRLEELELCTHVGTHMDAPLHVLEEGFAIDEYPLAHLHGPGVCFDLTGLAPEAPIDAAALEPYADRTAAGSIALLRTGWGERRAMTDWYVNRSPWVDASGATWLVEHGAVGVAIDHFSIAGRGPAEKVQPAHHILLGAGVWIVEEARFPAELLDGSSWYVVALPLRLEGASGAQTRLIAIEQAEARS
jgi:kynurenine formamidase